MNALCRLAGGAFVKGDTKMKLIFLSDKFYDRHKNCKEILQKPERPYACLGVRIDRLLFAVPFRHHISHKYAFIIDGESGLDYTKAVMIRDQSDISDRQPWIDQKSFNAVKGKEANIKKGMENYLKLYRKARKYKDNPHYRFILQCSALSHFDSYI